MVQCAGQIIKKPRNESIWVKRIREIKKEYDLKREEEAQTNAEPIHHARLCKEIRDHIDKDASIVLDGGDISVWAHRYLKARFPGQIMTSIPYGQMGLGMGFAIGAQIARPGKQVVNVSGDGAFGLNAMELETALRHKLPILTIVANDGAWGQILRIEEILYGKDRVTGCVFSPNVRYDKVAEALGCYGEFVEKPSEIGPALDAARNSGLPSLINVPIDPTVRAPVDQFFASTL
jgi:acetolactate synthase-1/2/3 large subunit